MTGNANTEESDKHPDITYDGDRAHACRNDHRVSCGSRGYRLEILQAEIDSAGNGATKTLASDITAPSAAGPITVPQGKEITLDLNGVLCFAIILTGSVICLKRFPRNLEELMLITDGFGALESERIDITVRTREQVVSVSRQVEDFCLSRGIDRRRVCFSGLCMEEMAGNVVEHGFPKDSRRHSADIRVICRRKEILLRIRVNCRAFDPLQRAKLQEQHDDGKNVGIRLVYGIAREVTYQNLLGLNVLTILI